MCTTILQDFTASTVTYRIILSRIAVTSSLSINFKCLHDRVNCEMDDIYIIDTVFQISSHNPPVLFNPGKSFMVISLKTVLPHPDRPTSSPQTRERGKHKCIWKTIWLHEHNMRGMTQWERYKTVNI